MCRIAAYLGPPISLKRFLLDPEHSLYRQSWQAREALEASMCADGFGLAWYHNAQPFLYRQPVPIWNDANLPALANSLHSGVWVGNVRSATAGFGVHLQNTQPFASGPWVFTHNGRLGLFPTVWRPRIRELLNPDVEAGIEGSTDSEYVFGLIRHLGSGGTALEDALQAAFARLQDWHDDSRADALLNIAVTDGSRVLAARHALGTHCPSLYSCTAHPDFPGAVLLASEPFDQRGDWKEVPTHHFISLMPGHDCRVWAI